MPVKPIRRDVSRVRPNAICPCRSGRKWKRCHGRPGMPNPFDPLSVFAEADPEEAAEGLQPGGAGTGGMVETAREAA